MTEVLDAGLVDPTDATDDLFEEARRVGVELMREAVAEETGRLSCGRVAALGDAESVGLDKPVSEAHLKVLRFLDQADRFEAIAA